MKADVPRFCWDRFEVRLELVMDHVTVTLYIAYLLQFALKPVSGFRLWI